MYILLPLCIRFELHWPGKETETYTELSELIELVNKYSDSLPSEVSKLSHTLIHLDVLVNNVPAYTMSVSDVLELNSKWQKVCQTENFRQPRAKPERLAGLILTHVYDIQHRSVD